MTEKLIKSIFRGIFVKLGSLVPVAKKTNIFFTYTLVVLPKVEKKNFKKNPLGERSACLVFELLVFAKNNLFWVVFFACLGVRVRCCSSYRRKTCNRSVLWNLSSYYKGFSLKMCEISPFAHLTATSTLILLKSKVSNPPPPDLPLKKKRYVLL